MEYDGLDLGEEFDIDVESMEIEERSYGVIPAGEYLMQLDKSEMKNTKAGGLMLAATFRIIDGDYENRLIFENFNLKGSEQAVKIGTENLGRLCKAVGAPTIRYPEAYTHKPFIGKVRVQQSKDPQYPDPQNRVVEYYPLDHAQAPEPPKQVGPRPAARPAQASAPASAGKSRPWDKKAS